MQLHSFRIDRRGEGVRATLAHKASQGQRLAQYHTTLEATRWDFNVPCRECCQFDHAENIKGHHRLTYSQKKLILHLKKL